MWQIYEASKQFQKYVIFCNLYEKCSGCNARFRILNMLCVEDFGYIHKPENNTQEIYTIHEYNLPLILISLQRMIYGAFWAAACKFFSTYGDIITSVTDMIFWLTTIFRIYTYIWQCYLNPKTSQSLCWNNIII